MKTLRELLFALILGATIGTMLFYSLDADLEAREAHMIVPAVVKGDGK